ncbi:glycosyltransferase family 4 protein [Mucilaginibacter myungsuensis]|uniref:Glycosyltransferase family 4 protein n=1 Tax=Mucilaginibacter myungsuensis TaxID=649104 RepID=A0A929PXK3_9SPHI|nr:glycosyltransferase family 1 protein [Mucilaginibacter myungsuensis]MBE9662347.1 glycosyltransferase family 4 protein [Mucilaginibacter myungsuensis]MDN3599216.1 glycosyltransferase family 1 protein [Mucilaginibacter myungsuensis]
MKPLRILFDHQIFSVQRYGGISRYFNNLDESLDLLPNVDSKIAAVYSENAYIDNDEVLLNNALGRRIFKGHQSRIYRWNRRYSSLRIRNNNFDVFHPTYYDPYFLDDLKKPFVLTVHDMIHEVMEDQFTDNNQVIPQKKLLIEKATAVIAISEYTKSDIIKFYPEAESKIRVIHHGFEYVPSGVGRLSLPGRYILFVGERYFYKNFVGMAKAIAPLLNADPTRQLICTAGGNFTDEELVLFDQLKIKQQCRQINASDAELHQLYRQALVFVFPSFSEGFGFPLLEAFTAGCPVAASDNSCFPEIGGDAAAYFDPNNDESIRETVSKLLTDEGLRQTLIENGYERLKQFTVQKCVNETLELYRELAK